MTDATAAADALAGCQGMHSLGDPVAAIVLWDRLDAADRGKLLGLWARLLP